MVKSVVPYENYPVPGVQILERGVQRVRREFINLTFRQLFARALLFERLEQAIRKRE